MIKKHVNFEIIKLILTIYYFITFIIYFMWVENPKIYRYQCEFNAKIVSKVIKTDIYSYIFHPCRISLYPTQYFYIFECTDKFTK